MASRDAIDAARKRFLHVYGKDLPEGAAEEWEDIFRNVPDRVFQAAVRFLIENRENTFVITPGEMAEAVKSVGGSLRAQRTVPDTREWVPIKALGPEMRTKKEETCL